MTVTIGAFSCRLLQVQPFGYEGDARAGLTARKFTIQGLLTPVQDTALLGVYNNWRDLRIADDDTLLSGTVGSTVSLTAATDNTTVTALPCWFTQAPQTQQLGIYKATTVELVDAAQALQVLLRSKEKEREASEALRPSFGTVTLGSAVITLTKPMETYTDVPQLQLTPGGFHHVTGPLTFVRVRDIEGYCSSSGWTSLQTWYETTVATSPAANSWFPQSAPTATAEVIIDGGVKSTRYTVRLPLLQVH